MKTQTAQRQSGQPGQRHCVHVCVCVSRTQARPRQCGAQAQSQRQHVVVVLGGCCGAPRGSAHMPAAMMLRNGDPHERCLWRGLRLRLALGKLLNLVSAWQQRQRGCSVSMRRRRRRSRRASSGVGMGRTNARRAHTHQVCEHGAHGPLASQALRCSCVGAYRRQCSWCGRGASSTRHTTA